MKLQHSAQLVTTATTTVIVFILSVKLFGLVVATDLNSDTQALLDFASAVPHVRKINWSPASSVCTTWIGVTCNKNGSRVIAIRLPGVGLFGNIPTNTLGKLDALQVLSLRSNFLNGNLPSDISSIPSLQYLYLQDNNFSGAFPLFSARQLIALDLSFNSFTGNVPPTIQNLTQLVVLNLQNNTFFGVIPSIDLPKVRVFSLSNNNLSGSIPYPLQNFPISSFSGNSLLCGHPLNTCSSTTATPPPPPPPSLPRSPTQTIPNTTKKKKFGLASIISIAVGVFAVLFLSAVMIFLCCIKKVNVKGRGVLKGKVSIGGAEKPKDFSSGDFGSGVQEPEKNKLFFFEGCSYGFDLEDLLRASAEVLGKGSYGTTYKACLEDSTTVVVKRLREVAAGKKEFEQQMELVGRAPQHPNVTPLRAYYYSKDEKLLVYNYMAGGSLFALLHGNRGPGRTPLDWDTRMKIALGTANGISHVHSDTGLKTVHGNIKSSNVLITEDLDGCISDVGLAPVMNFPVPMSRTFGYRAPEQLETRKATQCSDVYSFGVLLLEMLTGKSPIRLSGHDDVIDLPRWVRSVVREEWTAEVFDVELLRYQNIEEEMVQMLQIALSCVSKVPDTRPTMDEVVKTIEAVRQPELKNRSSSEADSSVQTP